MALSVTPTAKRQERILVAQVLPSLRHMVDVYSIKVAYRAIWIQRKVFLPCLRILDEFFRLSC